MSFPLVGFVVDIEERVGAVETVGFETLEGSCGHSEPPVINFNDHNSVPSFGTKLKSLDHIVVVLVCPTQKARRRTFDHLVILRSSFNH